MRDPITRRAALSSATVAGLAGVWPGKAEAQPEPLIVNRDDLAVESRRLKAEVLEALQALNKVDEEIRDRLGYDLMNQISVAESDFSITHQHWIFAELVCHLPGLAPVLRMLETHIVETAY